MNDYYGTLGIPKTATPDEIKTAYRRLASKNHPDKGGDTATFQNIQVAYDTLSDPGRRAAYDNPRQQHIPPGFGNAGQFDFDSIFTISPFLEVGRSRFLYAFGSAKSVSMDATVQFGVNVPVAPLRAGLTCTVR